MGTVILNPEQIKNFRQTLKKYKPYSEKEILELELDSKSYDFWRWYAYMAQKALKEAGLLEE